MNGVTLPGSPRVLLTHLALYGLAAICHDANQATARLGWTGGMNPRPHLHTDRTPDEIAQIVRAHARAATTWTGEVLALGSTARGLMSPRISVINDDAQWRRLQEHRHRVLDALTESRRELDLRLIAALGEPCYWRYTTRENPPRRLQDDASSRLEMQPRNQGSEFVGTRLNKIAAAVADRAPEQIRDALLGTYTNDEAGNNKPDSRSATGLDAPGPVDNTLVWCALWGIAHVPLALAVTRPATTAASVKTGREYIYVPFWRGRWHPARLRTIIASSHLREAATESVTQPPASNASHPWLSARGVMAVITFPVGIFGSQNAPERRTATGHVTPIGTP
jgi:CRISPR-associated protein Csb3